MAREFTDVDELVAWSQSLDDRWPERCEVKQQIGVQLQEMSLEQLHVVELCCGAGVLAEYLMQTLSHICYCGLDASQSLLNFTGERLAGLGDRVLGLHQVDLNDDWLGVLPERVDAIVSMQSLHDVGDEAAVNRVYGLAKQALKKGGMFLNADLATPEKPGRMSAERHLELLNAHGFDRVSCVLEVGAFVCVVGFCDVNDGDVA